MHRAVTSQEILDHRATANAVHHCKTLRVPEGNRLDEMS
jgi:hypothetical protein